MHIVLASQSPRRREMLALLGMPYIWIEPKCDESLPDGVNAAHGVRILAERKAKSLAERYPQSVCIGADTLVVHRDQIFGKPKDEQDAFRMLSLLQNDVHDVYTGICVYRACDEKAKIDYRQTSVRFVPISEANIVAYIATGEPMDKAGAYAIQGRAAAYVHSIVGSYDNVVGFPLSLAAQLLAEFDDCN